MPDYRNMDAVEAMRHAKDVSGLTAEQIAAVAGTSASVVRRYLNRDDYLPGFDRIPALCRAMRNTVLILWLQAQADITPVSVAPAQNRAEVLTAVARIAASLGDVQRRLAESEKSGINPACARDVRSLLGDVVEDCRIAMDMLQGMAQCANRTECDVLFSLRPVKKKPWWRVW